jgi:phage terminase large subunit-like protein
MTKLFPLPIPHEDRKSPLDFIPDCDDLYGYGKHIWEIFARLKITQGSKAGRCFGDDGVAVPWQKKFITSLFGHCDEFGIRDYDEALLYIAKKQGKSSMAGPLAVAMALAFPEDRGFGIVLASTQKQATIVYDSMCATIEADPYLLTLFKIRRYKNDIVHLATDTILAALPLEQGALVGVIPSFCIVDELHVCGLLQKAKQLIEQAVSGQAVRENPMTIYLTTAPLNKSSGVFASMYDRALRVLRGESPEDKLFPVLFEMPEDHDPEDNKAWWMANPSLGYTFSAKWLQQSFNTAKNDPDPTSLMNFYSQHLNIQVGEKFGITNWIPEDVWKKFADVAVSFESILKLSEIIYVSADLGFRDDPSALVVMGERTINDKKIYSIWSQQYLHEEGYNLRREHVPYDDFIASGELKVSARENYDVHCMTDMIFEVHRTGKLAAVGVDPMGLVDFATLLEARRINVIGIKQGYQMNPSLIATERFLYSGQLRHDGKPMLTWNVGNGLLAERGQAMALVKPRDVHTGKEKIDGLVCVVMCVALACDPEIKPKTIDINAMIG